MRSENEMPMTPLEQEIEDILVNNRYLPEYIIFTDSAWDGVDGNRYLQLGAFQRLTDEDMSYLGDRIVDEFVSDIEATGVPLYYYTINSSMVDTTAMEDMQTMQPDSSILGDTIMINGVQYVRADQMPNGGMSNV